MSLLDFDPLLPLTGSLFECLNMAVISLDAQLRIIALNPSAETLFGVNRYKAQGKPIIEAVPGLFPLEARLRETFDASVACTLREFILKRQGVAPVRVDITMTALPPNFGDHRLVLECVAMERLSHIGRGERLRAQHRISREVVRSLAHEIKNPLGGLRGAAQLLQRELDDPELKAYTGVIVREADRLNHLVDRLAGSGRPQVRRPTNIHRIVDHVHRLVSAHLPADVELVRDYDPSIPEVSADEGQLIQALLNVVQNAVQAVGDAGQVTLRTRTRRQFTIGQRRHRFVVRVDVIDNGPGFDSALAERIFFPLVTTRAEGSGLGLPIAQNLVHGHGGAIECESDPGRTIFSIYLPCD